MSTNIIFICGHRKCGTTMFADLFDGHEKLSVFPTDLSIFYGYFPEYINNNKTTNEQIERLENVIFLNLKRVFNENILNLDEVVDLKLMRNIFFSNLNRNKLNEIKHIFITLLNSFHETINVDSGNKKWILVKETSLEIYSIELAELFPESKFIQLIRDPRDNYSSLKSGSKKHYQLFGESEKHSLFSLINRYTQGFKSAKINQNILGEDRYKIVKFEDLCRDSEEVMRNISNFLGVEYTENFLTPTVLGKSTIGNNFEGENFQKISDKNVGRWNERLTQEEAKIIEYHFSHYMEDYGYNLKYNIKEQHEAAVQFYKWFNYKYLFKDSFSNLNKNLSL